jgi:hypothetical protein
MHRWGANIKPNLLLFMGAAVFLPLWGCYGPGKCGETISQSLRSPDGNTTATVTIVDCGAMTDFFSYVSIHTTQVKLRDEGILLGYNGKPQLEMSWAGPKELAISCPRCISTKVYRQVLREGEYRITYAGFDAK